MVSWEQRQERLAVALLLARTAPSTAPRVVALEGMTTTPTDHHERARTSQVTPAKSHLRLRSRRGRQAPDPRPSSGQRRRQAIKSTSTSPAHSLPCHSPSGPPQAGDDFSASTLPGNQRAPGRSRDARAMPSLYQTPIPRPLTGLPCPHQTERVSPKSTSSVSKQLGSRTQAIPLTPSTNGFDPLETHKEGMDGPASGNGGTIGATTPSAPAPPEGTPARIRRVAWAALPPAGTGGSAPSQLRIKAAAWSTFPCADWSATSAE